MSAVAQVAQVTVAERLPLDSLLVVEHSDERLLPDGTSARFEQRQRLRFTRQADQLVAELDGSDHRCVGAPALCIAYERLMTPMRAARYRLAIAPGGQVRLIVGTPAVGTADAAPASDPVAARVAGVVSRYEDGAAGAMVVNEVAQLLQFCGRVLPPPGEALSLPDGGTLIVQQVAGELAQVRIARPSMGSGATQILSETMVEIDLATGLVRVLTTRDWLGSRDTPPMRIRTTRLTAAIGPVS